MTAPTDFEKRLVELNLTYTQIELVKQAVEELVIGNDERVSDLDYDWALIETSVRMNGAKPYHLKDARNQFRGVQRAAMRGLQEQGVS